MIFTPMIPRPGSGASRGTASADAIAVSVVNTERQKAIVTFIFMAGPSSGTIAAKLSLAKTSSALELNGLHTA